MGQPVHRIPLRYADCELIVHNKKQFDAIINPDLIVAKPLVHTGFEQPDG